LAQLEPSEKQKAIAKNKGVSFVEETSELESFFDVISMWHVWNTFLIWKTNQRIETIAKTKWDFNYCRSKFQILRCKILRKVLGRL
jgi:hypothetical protein